MSVAGVILAGGLARRMGGVDKALVEIGGRPLIELVIERLRPQVDELVINANGDPGRFAAFGLPVVPDPVPGFAGPLAGVLAGMRWAAERGHGHVVSAAADTPFFPSNLVAQLRAAAEAEGAPIAMAATIDAERGLSEHPTFALWPVALADDLEEALTRGALRKIIVWAARHGFARAVFEGGGMPFFNINTPEDVARAERIMAAATRLAVYGTLGPGRSNHDQLAGLGGEWTRGIVRGRLVAGGRGAAHHCPGLVPDPEGEAIEVDILTSPALPANWDRLDAFEGADYRRTVVDAETPDGTVPVSIYALARPGGSE